MKLEFNLDPRLHNKGGERGEVTVQPEGRKPYSE